MLKLSKNKVISIWKTANYSCLLKPYTTRQGFPVCGYVQWNGWALLQNASTMRLRPMLTKSQINVYVAISRDY